MDEYKDYLKHGGDKSYMKFGDADEYLWKHHHLLGRFEPPSTGMFGSTGPYFDKTTGSSEPTVTLPAVAPQDQK